MGTSWRLAVIFLVAVLLMPLIGCGKGAEEGAEPYKIGVIAQLSGWAAPIARPAKDAFTWAVEQVNKNGGINGHHIEAIVYDTQSDATQVVLAARKLIYEDKVLAIASIGAGMEDAIEPLILTSEEVGIVIQSEGSTSKLLEAPATWIFCQSPPHSWSAADFYSFCKKRGLNRIGLLSSTASYGASGREQMLYSASKAGLTLVAASNLPPPMSI